jgi:hypothetical protein
MSDILLEWRGGSGCWRLVNCDTLEIVASVELLGDLEYIVIDGDSSKSIKRFVDEEAAKAYAKIWVEKRMRQLTDTEKTRSVEYVPVHIFEDYCASLDSEVTRICNFLRQQFGEVYASFKSPVLHESLTEQEVGHLLSLMTLSKTE